MKGIAFYLAALGRSIDESSIKMRIVPDQHGAIAVGVFNFFADYLEQLGERFVFIHCFAKRVVGVYAGKVESRLLDIGSLERSDIKIVGAVGIELPIFIHAHDGDGHFQQGIGTRVKAARLDIDNDR